LSIPIDYLIREAECMNVKLEVINGVTVWEASHVYKHQLEVKRIANSLSRLPNSNYGCIET
jgi:hypothetical protein